MKYLDKYMAAANSTELPPHICSIARNAIRYAELACASDKMLLR